MEDKQIQQVVGKIPDYDRFYTVDELKENSKKLAEEFPGVKREIIGKSRQGEPIEALYIGDGENTALLFAMPHPNEPIGSMTLEYFSRELAENKEFRDLLDYTFVIIKCSDPDGARLNEGWFGGPYTPLNYAKNFYRPPAFQQVEWTFPVDYKNLKFDEPIPETRALMKVMEDEKPNFIYSLHNSGFGGAYYYVSDPCEELYEPLRQSATEMDIPLHLGEPEVPYAEELSDAVFKSIATVERYDYLEENTDKDPSQIISGGTGSTEYGKRINENLFSLVSEVPYFFDPKIENHEESDIARKEAVLKGVEISEDMFGFLTDKYREIEDYLTIDSKFKETLDEYLEMMPQLDKSKRNWAKNNEELNTPATVSQKFDNLVITRFYRMLAFGMFVRMVDRQIEQDPDEGKKRLKEIRDETEKELERQNELLLDELDYQVIPIRKLVSVQLKAGLTSMDYLTTR